VRQTLLAMVLTLSSSLLSQSALAQSLGPQGKSTTDLADQSAELSFLSEACGDPRYKLSLKWLNQVGDPRIADQIARRFAAMLDTRPRPSRSRACSELLFKFGPNGVVERDWIEERTP